MPEFLFNKVAGLSPAILLKKKTLIQVFSDEFCWIFETPFLQNTSKKTATHAEKGLTSSLHILLPFKNFFTPLFFPSHDTLKARGFTELATFGVL